MALDDAELGELSADVEKLYLRLLDALGNAEPDRVSADSPTARDRVLRRLTALLDEKVLGRPSEEEWSAWIEEGNRRVAAQVPPGYLDVDKGDEHAEGAAGDFLVYWQAAMEAQRRELDLVVITGDEKEDWWWRHRSVFIGPRQEMVKEFFDLTGGRRLFLVRPRDLLFRSATLDVQVSPRRRGW